MSESLVDRAAARLADKHGADWNAADEAERERIRSHYRWIVVSVLNEIMEPTEEMWQAAETASYLADGREGDYGDFPSARAAHIVIGWRAMIGTMLGEVVDDLYQG